MSSFAALYLPDHVLASFRKGFFIGHVLPGVISLADALERASKPSHPFVIVAAARSHVEPSIDYLNCAKNPIERLNKGFKRRT